MLRVSAAERTLRTLTVNFVGPLQTGAAAHCHTQVLREGKSLTVIESRIVQDAAVRCIAVGAFGADRPSSVFVAPRRVAPVIDPARSFELPYIEGVTATFTQHFKFRWASAALPFTGVADAHLLGACSFRTEARVADHCDLLALIDSWPPSVLPMLRAPAPSSTVSWTVDFLDSSQEARTDETWTYEADAVAAGGGYAQTEAWLWNARGQAVARSVQLAAVFG